LISIERQNLLVEQRRGLGNGAKVYGREIEIQQMMNAEMNNGGREALLQHCENASARAVLPDE